MFVWDGGPTVAERMRREVGTWTVLVVFRGYDKVEKAKVDKVLVNEAGTIAKKGEVVDQGALCSIGTGRGLTINLGNYESARVDAWVTMPCSKNQLDETYRACEEFVTAKIADEVKKIKGESA